MPSSSIGVGPVIPIDDGYGFSITNDDQVSVVTFAYATAENADEARGLVIRAIANAVSVVTVGPRRADR